MAVRYPRYIKIVNAQLSALYWLLSLGFFGALVGNFFFNREYVITQDVSQYVQASMWINGIGNATKLAENVNNAMSTSYCSRPGMYDYWWDTATYKYVGMKCMPICDIGVTAFDCIPAQDTATNQDYPPLAYILTHFTDRYFPLKSAPQPADVPQSQEYFMMSADFTGVSVQYSFEIPQLDWLGSTTGSLKGSSFVTDGEGGVMGVTTVLVNAGGKVARVLPASPSIDISIWELLELTGNPDLLNGYRDLAGDNMMPGGRPGGPSPRIAGMEIRIVIECFSPPSVYLSQFEIDDDVGDVACTMSPQLSSKAWTYWWQQQFVGAGVRYRYTHGVRIRIETRGKFDFVDFNSIYLNCVSIMVLMALPGKVIYYLTMYGLGHMSSIYRRVICTDFDIIEQVAGMTTRLMANSTSFVHLQDIHGKDINHSGVSKHRMAERIVRVMHKKHQLDEVEVSNFVQFCFDIMQTEEKETNLLRKASSFISQLKQSSSSQSLTEMINMDRFSNAVMSAEPISFDDVVDLFDKHRKHSIMERMFFPIAVWNAVYGLHAEGIESGEANTLEWGAKGTVEWEKAQWSRIAEAVDELQEEAEERRRKAPQLQDLREKASPRSNGSRKPSPRREALHLHYKEQNIAELELLRTRLDATETKLAESESRLMVTHEGLATLKLDMKALKELVHHRHAEPMPNAAVMPAEYNIAEVDLDMLPEPEVAMPSIPDQHNPGLRLRAASSVPKLGPLIPPSPVLRGNQVATLDMMASATEKAVAPLRRRMAVALRTHKELEERVASLEAFCASMASYMSSPKDDVAVMTRSRRSAVRIGSPTEGTSSTDVASPYHGGVARVVRPFAPPERNGKVPMPLAGEMRKRGIEITPDDGVSGHRHNEAPRFMDGTHSRGADHAGGISDMSESSNNESYRASSMASMSIVAESPTFQV